MQRRGGIKFQKFVYIILVETDAESFEPTKPTNHINP